jgi:hypothetical protein
MIGKFILITLMIAVATGIILQFEGDITSSIGQILGGDDKPNINAEEVRVSADSPEQEIASLIDTCYQRYLEESLNDYVCFIARSSEGDINLNEEGVKSTLSNEVKEVTEFQTSGTGSIIIRYSSTRGKIVVE